MSEVILDVRERDEFDAEHIENSIHVPLSQFASMAPGVLNQLRERDVVIMCRSGKRAQLAAIQVEQLGFADKIRAKVFDGGILEWRRQGKPTIVKVKNHLPIMRQVQLVAGSMVLASTLLGAFVNPWFLSVSAFVGVGLTIAGTTGFCGMASILAWMPWNQSLTSTREELCNVSPKSSGCGK